MDSNAAGTTQSQDGRRRTAPRVAIPFSLTRPRTGTQTKSQTAAPAPADGAAAADKVDNNRSEALDTAAKTGANDAAQADTVALGEQKQVNGTNEATESASSNDEPNGNEVNEELSAAPQTDSPKRPTQIRTELPPAFVPSSNTPQTASSSAQSRVSQSLHHSQAPYSRPASTHLAFSTDDSGTPSPVPHNGYNPYTGARHSPHASTFAPQPTYRPADAFNGNGYTSPQHAYSRSNGHFRHYPRDSYASIDLPHDYRPTNEHPAMSPVYPGLPPPSRYPIEDALALRQYVSSLYSSEAFADVRLQLSFLHKQASTTFLGHRLILARSPAILRAIEQSGSAAETVNIEFASRWANERATQEAIWSLYGGTLLADNNDISSIPGDSNTGRLRYVLGYITAGQTLELPAAAHRGVEIASNTLSWDALPTCLEYTLEGGLPPSWSREPSSSRPVNEPAATPLLHAIMNFMVSQIPHDFQLDTGAADTLNIRQTPPVPPVETSKSVTHRASRSINDPRLSRLRFGDVGGSTSGTISGILLSLPFELLAALLEHPALSSRFGIEHLTSIARSIVAERESRRDKAAKALSASGEPRYEESVEGTNTYIKLSRRHIA